MSNDRPRLSVNPLDAIGTFFDVTGGIGDFIANGTPDPDSIPGKIQQRYRDHCDSWSRGEQWINDLTAAGRLGMSSLCNPWLDSQGSGDPVPGDPPFTGGQCPVPYDVTCDGWDTVRGDEYRMAFLPRTQRVMGPIQGVVAYEIGAYPGRLALHVRGADGDAFFTVPHPDSTSNTFAITEIERRDGQPDDCGNPPPSGDPAPNPNPRPDPGLDPEEKPFVDPTGQPVFPMPRITDPFGDPVQLPNFPFPNPFLEVPPGGSGTGGNPNAGPEPEPSDDIPGTPDGTDDDFGDPPEGQIWVGFTVRVSNQGLTHGLWANTGDEPVYREPTGVVRPVFTFDGDTVLGNPIMLSQELTSYWIEAAGLPLSGARVSILGNETYSVTPYSQPIQEENE
jgi:hypothetical protein